MRRQYDTSEKRVSDLTQRRRGRGENHAEETEHGKKQIQNPVLTLRGRGTRFGVMVEDGTEMKSGVGN